MGCYNFRLWYDALICYGIFYFPIVVLRVYMIDRILGPQLKKLAEWYPIVSVTGPRQSGKSTLVQAAFPDYLYVNLEEPAVRARALADPTGFVATSAKDRKSVV